MTTALLLVIYLSYIGLGLPDTLLGAAWPAMRADLACPLYAAGLVSLAVSFFTVVSSLLSGRLLYRFGTGPVAFFSVLSTSLGLLGFSLAPSLSWLLVLSVPLGMGAGAVDTGLNNFVALHYKPIHMNLLHCFWGLGAMCGPAVLAVWLSGGSGWRMGYRSVAAIQLLPVAVLALSLPLWRRSEGRGPAREEKKKKPVGNREALSLPGVRTTLLALLFYCSLELTAELWASSYLVERRGASAENGALYTSLFYGCMAGGRLLAGLLSEKAGAPLLIRSSLVVCAAGALLLLLPLPLAASAAGLCLFGLGCAPLYPALLRETPDRFGREASQTVMGLEMAVSYIGSTTAPPLLGLLAQALGMGVFPWFLLASVGLMVIFRARLDRSPA